MTVLLTGATGFVGRHAAEALSASGHRLRCLVRSPEKAAHLRAAGHEIVPGHLLDDDALRAAVANVDAVVHVAGLIAARSRRAMWRVNVEGTARLAAACHRRPPRRFVLVSSLAAGGPSTDGAREDDAPRPVSGYGHSKLGGERAARRALPAETALTVIRPPAVYGPHDRGILEFFRAAAGGLRLRLGTEERPVSIVHGADLADGIRRALEVDRAAGRTYYVADARAWPINDLLAHIADAVGRRGVAVRLPECALRGAGVLVEEIARLRGRIPTFSRDKACEFLAPGWVCDSSRATRELGWTPTRTLAEGLAETARWYRAHGWIK